LSSSPRSFYCSRTLRYLHSFPTRRSSDLDEPSEALFADLSHVERGLDDAWLAASDPTAEHGLGWGSQDARERDFVIVAQSDLLGIEVDELARRIIRQLKHLGATGDNIAYVECIPEFDHKVLDHLREIDPELMEGTRV